MLVACSTSMVLVDTGKSIWSVAYTTSALLKVFLAQINPENHWVFVALFFFWGLLEVCKSEPCYLMCSAWIADDQVWPYVKFRSKFMITQKVPQSFKEAVDSIEEQLKAGGDMATSNLVILWFVFLMWHSVCPFSIGVDRIDARGALDTGLVEIQTKYLAYWYWTFDVFSMWHSVIHISQS